MSVFVPVPNPVAELITTPTVAALLGLTIPYTQQLFPGTANPAGAGSPPGRRWRSTWRRSGGPMAWPVGPGRQRLDLAPAPWLASGQVDHG